MFNVINERNAIRLSLNLQVGRLENAIGWYHSHPGYGCWLSGIDVSTQMLNQQFQEPFVAVVVRQRNTYNFSFKAICTIFLTVQESGHFFLLCLTVQVYLGET